MTTRWVSLNSLPLNSIPTPVLTGSGSTGLLSALWAPRESSTSSVGGGVKKCNHVTSASAQYATQLALFNKVSAIPAFWEQLKTFVIPNVLFGAMVNTALNRAVKRGC